MPANIDFTDGFARSADFSDVYFSQCSGLDETNHVFIQHNDLVKRFKTGKSLVIAELGFGMGLNCLVTLEHWSCCSADREGSLHYIGIEKSPPSLEDIRRALAPWPDLASNLAWLLSVYPPSGSGVFHLKHPRHRVSMTLLIGDVDWALSRINDPIDAWFLDGFAPSKNPDMWSDTVFQSMQSLSHSKTTVATYTAAGHVRRGLAAAGFVVSKVPGFGRKREMLAGFFLGSNAVAPMISHIQKKTRVAVIGAGVAGCTQAHALASRGFEVLLFDKASSICHAASSVPQALLKPVLHVKPSVYERYQQAGFSLMQSYLYSLTGGETTDGIYRKPTLLLPHRKKNKDWALRYMNARQPSPDYARWVESSEASDIAGISIDSPALLLPSTWHLSPQLWCEKRLSEFPSRIELHLNEAIVSHECLQPGIHLHSNLQKEYQVDYLVIANAGETNLLETFDHIPLNRRAGQVSTFGFGDLDLSCVLSYGGYCFQEGNRLHVGSTFRDLSSNALPDPQDNQENWERLRAVVGSAIPENTPPLMHAFAQYRCNYRDHLPLVGPFYARSDYFRSSAPCRETDRRRLVDNAIESSGVYLNMAHASRGLSGALLAGELITGMIANTTRPLSSELIASVDPNRVWAHQSLSDWETF